MKKSDILMFFTNKAIIIAIGAFLLVGFSSVFVFDPFNLNLSFFKNELAIDKTANVITEIKKISEFTTACYYEDKIIDHKKYEYFDREVKKGKSSGILSSLTSVFSSDTNKVEVVKDSTESGRIVYIVRTKVKAGYDFSKIEEGGITVQGDTLCVKLPPVEIFDIIANPSDWTLYYHDGEWEDAEIRTLQSNSKAGIKQDAINAGIIEKAETYGKEEIAMLFKTFGFKEVNLE